MKKAEAEKRAWLKWVHSPDADDFMAERDPREVFQFAFFAGYEAAEEGSPSDMPTLQD